MMPEALSVRTENRKMGGIPRSSSSVTAAPHPPEPCEISHKPPPESNLPLVTTEVLKLLPVL